MYICIYEAAWSCGCMIIRIYSIMAPVWGAGLLKGYDNTIHRVLGSLGIYSSTFHTHIGNQLPLSRTPSLTGWNSKSVGEQTKIPYIIFALNVRLQ